MYSGSLLVFRWTTNYLTITDWPKTLQSYNSLHDVLVDEHVRKSFSLLAVWGYCRNRCPYEIKKLLLTLSVRAITLCICSGRFMICFIWWILSRVRWNSWIRLEWALDYSLSYGLKSLKSWKYVYPIATGQVEIP